MNQDFVIFACFGLSARCVTIGTVSATPAIHFLRAHKVPFTEHPYRYEERGGTAVSSRELGVDEHVVIKTLVMEDERKQPLIVLMHGDRDVSTKNLARQIGRKTVAPCAPEVAQKHTGYLVGGTSPFGTRKAMPVYMERTIADLDRIYINGGRRGFLIALAPADLVRALVADAGGRGPGEVTGASGMSSSRFSDSKRAASRADPAAAGDEDHHRNGG